MENSIRMSDKIDLVVPCLKALQIDIGAVPKNGKNKFHGYDYASIGDHVKAFNEHADNHGLMLVFAVRSVEALADRERDKGGNERMIRVHLTARVLHVSGQWIEIDCFGEGADVGDKAIYKAITGARKYAIQLVANLLTGDDPEATEAKPALPATPTEPPKSYAAEAPAAPSEDERRRKWVAEQVEKNSAVYAQKDAAPANPVAEQVGGMMDLLNLIEDMNVPSERKNRWLEKFGVSRLAELPDEAVKQIYGVLKKEQSKSAA